MYYIYFLLLFPLLSAFILLFLRNYTARKITVAVSCAAIAGVIIFYAIQNFFGSVNNYYVKNAEIISWIFLGIEFLLTCYIVYLGIKHKRLYVSLLSLVQSGIIFWLELSGKTEVKESYHLYIDKFSIIMALVIAVVGCLICLYAVGYMKSYHNHHKEYKDRSPVFFAMLFLFLSAMFGIVFSNNIIWLFFFWEITTICSFLLIGYTKTKEAVNNSFRALWMNLIGGLAFALAIAFSAIKLDTLSLQDIIHMSSKEKYVIIPVFLLCVAALIKSAQMPFSKWLLGAMVAPTPTSALLHSATMVKAGVYLLIRLCPLLAGNFAGVMVATIGGFTFLAASLIAISQDDGKKVLAYSTIANLGLITACVGLGKYEAAWAAILLILFHAVSKSLLFLSVGAVENRTTSRNIEDMHGLIVRLPGLAYVMIIGIAGMFLAPFGMLISKWAALKSFIDANNMLLIFFLVFGSAATLFYWTKWLTKLISGINHDAKLKNTTKGVEWFSLITHAVIMISLCLFFPYVSSNLIQPFLSEIFTDANSSVISSGNIHIMSFMLTMVLVLPFAIKILSFGKKTKEVSAYMCGANTGDDKGFIDSFGERKKMYTSNWYMEDMFGEKRLLVPSIVISTLLMVTMLIIGIGGVI